MADIIGQETWSANGKSYVIKVTEPGATVTENAISIVSPVMLRKGDPNAGPLQPILASQLSFTIRDNSKLFQAAITDKELGDIVLEFTEDGNTLFKGFVIPEYQRNLIYETNPTYNVSAYDGINGLQGITYDQVGTQTVREQLYNISNKIGLSLQLNSFFDWEATGADSSTDDVDKLRICVEQLLSDEGATYYDMLELLCEFYTAQFFQEDGEWYFMQRHLRGATMTNYPTNSAGGSLTDETANFIFNVSNSTLHRRDSFFDKYPASSRVVSKHVYPNYLIKNPDWVEGNKYWDNNNQDEANGTNRRITGNDGYLRQVIGTTFIISDSPNDRLGFDFSVSINVASGTGTHDVDYCKVTAKAPDGSVWYLTGASAWQATTETYISRSIDFGTFSGGTDTFLASFVTPIMPDEPIQITIELFFDKDASGSAVDLNYIEFGPINMIHIKPDEADDVFRATEYSVTEETGKLGDSIEDTYRIGDTDNSTFYGVGVFEYYDGSSWLPTQTWAPDSVPIHKKRTDQIKDQVDERLEVYDFSHAFGEDPKLYNTFSYNPDSLATGKAYVPTFIEKEYTKNGKVKAISSSRELLDSVVATAVPANAVYFSNATKIKKAPIEDSGTYTIETLVSSITSGRTIDQLRVDESAGYMFAKEYVTASTDDRHLRRYDLDGSNPTDIVSWTSSPTFKLAAFSLARVAQKIYCMEVETATNGYRVTRRAYDGTLEATLFTDADHVSGASGHGIGLSPDELYVFWRSKSGTNDRFYKHTIADVSEVSIQDITEDPVNGYDNGHDEYRFDPNIAQGVFLNIDLNLRSLAFPDGGNESTIATTIVNTTDLAIERSRQWLVTVTSSSRDDIQKSNYDGSSPTTVIEDTEAITSLDLGFN